MSEATHQASFLLILLWMPVTILGMTLVTNLESTVYPVPLVYWDSKHMSYPFQDTLRPGQEPFLPTWVHETWALWSRCSARCQPCCEGETSEATTGTRSAGPSQPLKLSLLVSGRRNRLLQEGMGRSAVGGKGWRARWWQGLCSHWTPPNPEFSKKRYKKH